LTTRRDLPPPVYAETLREKPTTAVPPVLDSPALPVLMESLEARLPFFFFPAFPFTASGERACFSSPRFEAFSGVVARKRKCRLPPKPLPSILCFGHRGGGKSSVVLFCVWICKFSPFSQAVVFGGLSPVDYPVQIFSGLLSLFSQSPSLTGPVVRRYSSALRPLSSLPQRGQR